MKSALDACSELHSVYVLAALGPILSNFRMGMSSVGTTGSWAAVESVCDHVMFRTMAYLCILAAVGGAM